MSSDTNIVIITGEVADAPLLQSTARGDMVAKVNLAVRREYNGGVSTTYVKIEAWGRDAQALGNLYTGVRLLVSGSIRKDAYTDKSGQKRYETYVRADSVQIIGQAQQQPVPPMQAQGYVQRPQYAPPPSPARPQVQAPQQRPPEEEIPF